MTDDGYTVKELIGVLIAVAFSIWAWVVKKFGDRHLETQDDHGKDLKALHKDLYDIKLRLALLENSHGSLRIERKEEPNP